VVRTLHLPEDLKLCGDDCTERVLYSHVVAVRGYVNTRPRRDGVRPRRLFPTCVAVTRPFMTSQNCHRNTLLSVTYLPIRLLAVYLFPSPYDCTEQLGLSFYSDAYSTLAGQEILRRLRYLMIHYCCYTSPLVVFSPDNPSQCDDVCNTCNIRGSVCFTKSTNSRFYQVINPFLLHRK
jgi:hypothetical protein